jgi:hypothetical protein
MQRTKISNVNTRVTPAEYARRIGVNRSTVSRQIKKGVIPTHSGLVDPAEADERRANYLSISRGRNTLAQRQAGRAWVPEAEDSIASRLAALTADGGTDRAAWRELLDTLVRGSDRIPAMALELGLTMPQALSAAEQFRSLVIVLAGDIADAAYNWDLDDIPHAELDLEGVSALAQRFKLRGKAARWRREADELNEKADPIVFSRDALRDAVRWWRPGHSWRAGRLRYALETAGLPGYLAELRAIAEHGGYSNPLST